MVTKARLSKMFQNYKTVKNKNKIKYLWRWKSWNLNHVKLQLLSSNDKFILFTMNYTVYTATNVTYLWATSICDEIKRQALQITHA